MKVYQIKDGICYYDATSVHRTLESTVGKYNSEIVFVEAPDYVFEGWGYDETKEGDERFIKPTPPEGWLYDDETGTFYLESEGKPTTPQEVNISEMQTKIAELEVQLAAAKILLGVE